MRYISPQQVIYIHEELTKRFGLKPGVRDMRLLESSVLRMRASFGGEYLYPSAFAKAAAMMQVLLIHKPFVAGNRAIAFVAAGFFLTINNYVVHAPVAEFEDSLFDKEEEISYEETISWIKAHTL